MNVRGTTDVQVNESLRRLLEKVRHRVDPDYLELFRCSGGCEDTGWVVVDDGLASDGSRVRAVTVRRCAKCGGRASKRTQEVPAGGSFS